jgi:ATP-dependent RNA helicase DDX56/DBP9
VVFKLKLVKGKCIIFVGDIDRCYRLKLYLEQFGIKSCVLNSELPVNSRIHIVEEFNKNVYDIIIATDENEVLGDEEDVNRRGSDATSVNQAKKQKTDTSEVAEIKENGEEDVVDGEEESKTKKKRKNFKKDREYGVSRGIDFQNVACVLNFDLPSTSKSYTHRIGRTARAGKAGMAISFVIPKDEYRKSRSTSFQSCENDENTMKRIMKHQEKNGRAVKPYAFDMKQVDAFRYRMGDALRAVTRIAIREARTRELRQELLKSEKLKRHFEEHPEDLQQLRHDGESRAAKIQPHLKHIPEYLLPQGVQAVSKKGGEAGFVGFGKVGGNRIRNARAANKARGKGKKKDPLKNFKGKIKGKKA